MKRSEHRRPQQIMNPMHGEESGRDPDPVRRPSRQAETWHELKPVSLDRRPAPRSEAHFLLLVSPKVRGLSTLTLR